MKTLSRSSSLQELISEAATPITGSETDFDSLLDRVGDARYVLLGESTHGTHEFYQARSRITQRLLEEKGFTIVAWEADWPDALRLNRYVRGYGPEESAREALSGFKRFPVWMWRNTEIVALLEWMREFNSDLDPDQPKAGLYGLDLYSLHASMDAVISYLEKISPPAAAEARKRYSCFEDFGGDPQSYGMTAALHQSLSCEDEVVQQLTDLQRRAAELLRRDGPMAEDEFFYAEQNARVARNAEQYYRAMYRGRPNTWNLRDTHMVDTLDSLIEHFERSGQDAKAVIWAHNSHLGDARATEMARRGEHNVGQLLRERHGDETVLAGFTTFHGAVTAASEWGGATERKRVRPALEGSFERLFHECDSGDFMLRFDEHPELHDLLNTGKLERAIGVIYRPETERYSHYFFADLAGQFDLVLHFDETEALKPLDITSEWEAGELPETYPTGF